MNRQVKNGHPMWATASRQFVRAVRGERSQLAFSRRLKYRGNPVADWEAGRRFPTAAKALGACSVAGIDVPRAFARFHGPSAEVLGTWDDVGVAAWLRAQRGSTRINDLAARSGLPRHSVSRWLSGSSRPRLPQFFALVDAMTGRGSDLIAELVDIKLVPDLLEPLRKRAAARDLAFDEPWTEAVRRLLETDAYAALDTHEPGWIARCLGIDPAIETRCLERMEDAGVIADVDGKFECRPLTIYIQSDAERMGQIKRHWGTVALARMESLRPEDRFSYNVISVSADDLERVGQILSAAYREIRGLVAASSPVERVALVQLQLVDWGGGGDGARDPQPG